MIIESALLAFAFFFFVLGLLHGSDVVEDPRGNVTQQAPVVKPLLLLSAATVFIAILAIPLAAVIATVFSSKPYIVTVAGERAVNMSILYAEPSVEQGPPLVSAYYAVIVLITMLAPPTAYYTGYILGDWLAAEDKQTWKPPALLQRKVVYIIEEEGEKPKPVIIVKREVTYLDELL